MSEKLCHTEFNSDTAKHDVRMNNITVNSWVEENEAFISCKLINTAADAWKARETKSDSLKSIFAKYTRLYEASEHPFSSFYGNILHELRSIAAELGIELEKP